MKHKRKRDRENGLRRMSRGRLDSLIRATVELIHGYQPGREIYVCPYCSITTTTHHRGRSGDTSPNRCLWYIFAWGCYNAYKDFLTYPNVSSFTVIYKGRNTNSKWRAARQKQLKTKWLPWLLEEAKRRGAVVKFNREGWGIVISYTMEQYTISLPKILKGETR